MGLAYSPYWRQDSLVCAVNDDVADVLCPMSWGWIAVGLGVEQGMWLDPTEASDLVGVHTATLRRWAHAGIISCIQWSPGKHHRYLDLELKEITRLATHGIPPTLALLRHWLDSTLNQ